MPLTTESAPNSFCPLSSSKNRWPFAPRSSLASALPAPPAAALSGMDLASILSSSPPSAQPHPAVSAMPLMTPLPTPPKAHTPGCPAPINRLHSCIFLRRFQRSPPVCCVAHIRQLQAAHHEVILLTHFQHRRKRRQTAARQPVRIPEDPQRQRPLRLWIAHTQKRLQL
ncbi:uncharacterized protein MONOS_1035 [Monocercomonoides exilis]|uniref:uncharacterized protein n=1 Tax=Monocercomonoides exilis TaxID=2049356 RepID=UPI00355AC91C|nr:hypothetical protein MONOS_1035 [Monocercomonoides exilis]|eukprot:MONOS_1035.1-p1 / transcript=MONOS_1035.1 / gene=MONOS_1035 / organism=Monocercomonoides_exilis_PA203 / gene_product=unspecified product / transcript_product=unspecified product / location=Mono_scaffold00017:170187-170693(+) / protein_length=169 / sequence_SO=supercontig / SO=protein_coding / is_pseudo=false